jgi:putative heme-binding domain-containing protein
MAIMPVPALLLLLLSSLAAFAQHGTDSRANPFQTPDDVAAGMQLYRANCAGCHGSAGSGGRSPDLTTGVFRRASTDEEMFRLIRNGVTGTEMPPTRLEGRPLWQLVAYVRSLSAGRAAAKATGDPSRGRALFTGTAGCLNCHRVGNEGSRTGPDLTEIGAATSLADLEAALVKPDMRVLAQNRWVQVVTNDGKTLNGRRLNEDSQSLQFLDTRQRLMSVRKDEVRSWQVLTRSAMPSYEGKLTQQQLQDLVAYLASLGSR